MEPRPTLSQDPDTATFDYAPTFADGYAQKLRERCPKKRNSPRVLSLFSGAGGLDIGFSDAGFSIVEKVEIEETFCQTLKANSHKGGQFKENAPVLNLDIREYSPSASNIDFVIGGPPCQSFSAAGARANGVAGTRDARGTLFQEYVRILKSMKPKGFLFENVYRIVGANSGGDWKRVISAFSEAGYVLRYRILDAADYGVPQHRERLIIVGIRKDLAGSHEFTFPRPTHGPDSTDKASHFTAGDALRGLTTEPPAVPFKGIGGMYGHLLEEIPPGLNYSFFTEKMGHPNPIFAWRSKFSDFLYKADPCRPVRTLKAQGGKFTGPFHWANRPFTIPELKRLQSFPDGYKISGSRGDQVKQLGNSVPPQLARVLAEAVYLQLFNTQYAHRMPLLRPGEELGFRKRKRALTTLYRTTAREVIKQLAVQSCPDFVTETYHAELTANLKWGVDNGGREFLVTETVTESTLTISCQPATKRRGTHARRASHIHRIEVKPVADWILPFENVALISDNTDVKSMAACWKAFEHFLSRNRIKADIVQLAGYYQYDCAFQCRVTSKKTDDFWRFVNAITEGRLVNKNLATEELAHLAKIGQDEVVAYLETLKEVGFEIRSSQTNSSIEYGHFLIPYCFPTLNERSVQRTKSLI